MRTRGNVASSFACVSAGTMVLRPPMMSRGHCDLAHGCPQISDDEPAGNVGIALHTIRPSARLVVPYRTYVATLASGIPGFAFRTCAATSASDAHPPVPRSRAADSCRRSAADAPARRLRNHVRDALGMQAGIHLRDAAAVELPQMTMSESFS